MRPPTPATRDAGFVAGSTPSNAEIETPLAAHHLTRPGIPLGRIPQIAAMSAADLTLPAASHSISERFPLPAADTLEDRPIDRRAGPAVVGVVELPATDPQFVGLFTQTLYFEESEPCPCFGVGLSASTIARLEEAAKKAEKGLPLDEDDWEAILEAICCGVLAPLSAWTDFWGFLSPIFKPIFTLLGLEGGWVEFPGVEIEILAHVDDVHSDSSGWTSVDVTVYETTATDSQGNSASSKGKGKMRVEIHAGAELPADPPLEWCQFRRFRGGLRLDTDGSGFMEVHIEGDDEDEDDEGEDGEEDEEGEEPPPIGPPEDRPPEADPDEDDWPPAPGPQPPPRPGAPLPPPSDDGGGDDGGEPVPPPRPGAPLPPPTTPR